VTADPLTLLQAVRSHAGRITLFCQAGEIKLPPADQRLTAYLEQSVAEVRAPKGGVFHPKVWLIRYVADGQPTRLRLVCASRNLTFDRCWDSILVLDGELIDRKNAFAGNHPLGDFIQALPGMAVRALPEATIAAIRVLGDEARKVQWDLPDGVTEMSFFPLGLETRTARPFGADVGRRPLLVLSPFVRNAQLQALAEGSPKAVLISRPDELAGLSTETLALFKSVYAFNPNVEDMTDTEEHEAEPGLSGLHAKIYVIDDGWNARLLLGSANATNAAFSRNVEFLIELVGSKKDFGIDALLAPPENGQVSFVSLLQPWAAAGKPPDAADVEREKLEQQLDELKHELAASRFRAEITSGSAGTYTLNISSAGSIPNLGGARLQCWPVTLRPDRAITIEGGVPLATSFDGLSLDALTGFLAFELILSSTSTTVARRFVCSMGASGMPSDRFERLLAAVLADKDNLMRLIWLLLEAQGLHPGQGAEGVAVRSAMPWKLAPLSGYPLLERILSSMVSDPERIGEIGRLIDELTRTPEGTQVVPQSLLQLWNAVKTLRPGATP
jgi:hypothetical protein